MAASPQSQHKDLIATSRPIASLEVVSERDSQNSPPREPLSLRVSSGLLFLSSALWRRRLGTSRGFGMEPEVTFRALCGAGGSVDEMHLGSEFEAFEGVNGLGHGSDSVVSLLGRVQSRREAKVLLLHMLPMFLGPAVRAEVGCCRGDGLCHGTSWAAWSSLLRTLFPGPPRNLMAAHHAWRTQHFLFTSLPFP